MYLIKFTQSSLLIFIIYTLLGCSTPRYEICSSDDFPVYYIEGSRLIILDEHIINSNEPLFEKTIQLLDTREYDKLEIYLENGEYSHDDLRFCMALMQFSQGHYEDAKVHLSNINDYKYECIVKLLKTDAEYERKLSEGLISPNQIWQQVEPRERAKNRSDLLNKYQEVFDCDSSEHNHYMVKARVKQLKYAK